MNLNIPAIIEQLPGSAPAIIDPTTKHCDNCKRKKRGCNCRHSKSHCKFSEKKSNCPTPKRQRGNTSQEVSPWKLLQWKAFFERPEVLKTLVGPLDEFDNIFEHESDFTEEIKSRTPLHWASLNGYIDIVKLLAVEFHMDANAQSINNVTPLHMAARNGHVKVVSLLSAYGADVEAKTSTGETPLHYAARNGHVEVIKQLHIELGAQINPIGDINFSPLREAVIMGHVDAVKLMIELGANNNDKAQLYYIAFGGNIDIVKLLINGLDIMPDNIIDVLIESAEKGYVDIVRWLITEGHAHANVRDNFGETPLHAAARAGHVSIARQLIAEFHAKININDYDGKTPLHGASETGQVEVLRMLVTEFHSDKDTPDNHGYTPLHCAAMFGHIEVVKMFVTEYGADAYAKTEECETLLHLAADNKKTEVVEWLIAEFGAKLNTKDKLNQTPLHKAVINNWRKSWRIAELLGDSFGDVDVKDIEGRTPLHLASEKGNILSVTLLVTKFGARINLTDNLDQTALHLAVKCPLSMRTSCLKIVRFLLNHMGANINVIESNCMTTLAQASSNVLIEAAKTFKDTEQLQTSSYTDRNDSTPPASTLCLTAATTTIDTATE